MAAKIARSSMGVGKLWMTDKGTFPIIFICGFASVAATASASRYLMANPDVCVDKERRANTTHHENESGAEWRGHRFRLANLKRNPINQSRQFDPAFAKTENQGISR